MAIFDFKKLALPILQCTWHQSHQSSIRRSSRYWVSSWHSYAFPCVGCVRGFVRVRAHCILPCQCISWCSLAVCAFSAQHGQEPGCEVAFSVLCRGPSIPEVAMGVSCPPPPTGCQYGGGVNVAWPTSGCNRPYINPALVLQALALIFGSKV